MTWQELRTLYPKSWVLVEALDAFTENGHRVFSTLQMVGAYNDHWTQAWDDYKAHHHADKQREFYILHTDRETLDIGVIDTFGRILS